MAIQITGTGTPAILQGREAISPGILTSVSLYAPRAVMQPGDVYASVDIVPTSQAPNLATIHLIDGMFEPQCPLDWKGFLTIDSAAEIIVVIRGEYTGLANLQIRRLTITNPQEIAKYAAAILK